MTIDTPRARPFVASALRLTLFSSALLVAGCGGVTGGEEIDLSTAELTVFQDPDSSFSTTELLDVDGEVISFTTDGRIVWVETSMAWANSRNAEWTTDGNTLRSDEYFTVAYGLVDGEFGGWITRASTDTVCDFDAEGDELFIDPTEETVAAP